MWYATFDYNDVCSTTTTTCISVFVSPAGPTRQQTSVKVVRTQPRWHEIIRLSAEREALTEKSVFDDLRLKRLLHATPSNASTTSIYDRH